MAGFGMDKDKNSSVGGFGMKKTDYKDEIDIDDSEADYLPDYLEMDSEPEGVFNFFYRDRKGLEQVLEIDIESPKIEAKGSGFSNADYELFLEYAEKALEEMGELENSYTLLEQVNDYARY